MKNATAYLLTKITEYKEPKYNKLGTLKSEYIGTIALVMTEFAEEAIEETMDRLNKGQPVHVGKNVYYLPSSKFKLKS